MTGKCPGREHHQGGGLSKFLFSFPIRKSGKCIDMNLGGP